MQAISLTLRSPACISLRPTAPGQPTESLRYLTGTVVRGALAAMLLRGRRLDSADLDDEERARFRRLFLSGAIVFANGWPLPEQAGGAHQIQIVPRTAWSLKRGGGWRGDGDAGVVDALAPLLRDGAEELTAQGFDRLDHEFALAASTAWRRVEVRRRLISRTALTTNRPELDPAPRGVAAAGQLYSFEAIETGQTFVAPLYGDPECIAELIALLPPLFRVSIGQGRSRGMGQTSASVLTLDDPPARDPAELARQAQDFTTRAGGQPAETVYLPVTLLSDALLRDDYLLPCASGEPAVTLARYSPKPPPRGMRLIDAVQSTRWVGGWDELRRLPRSPQLAVQQGSVWVYAVPAPALGEAINWWLDLEAGGIGERRAEGFGRLMLLHPFHAREATR